MSAWKMTKHKPFFCVTLTWKFHKKLWNMENKAKEDFPTFWRTFYVVYCHGDVNNQVTVWEWRKLMLVAVVNAQTFQHVFSADFQIRTLWFLLRKEFSSFQWKLINFCLREKRVFWSVVWANFSQYPSNFKILLENISISSWTDEPLTTASNFVCVLKKLLIKFRYFLSLMTSFLGLIIKNVSFE